MHSEGSCGESETEVKYTFLFLLAGCYHVPEMTIGAAPVTPAQVNVCHTKFSERTWLAAAAAFFSASASIVGGASADVPTSQSTTKLEVQVTGLGTGALGAAAVITGIVVSNQYAARHCDLVLAGE
jgi:starvation-inducible outer membrane lipoprotein